jgi:hypothetical protein
MFVMRSWYSYQHCYAENYRPESRRRLFQMQEQLLAILSDICIFSNMKRTAAYVFVELHGLPTS